ncbi:class D sortase [Sulfobacillus harzensis]|uniref:Class D sortase n=1 Tax=Sulfobacillus harzensis TaxID=2729629 RepID=A0A7Y0L6K6_9FIRM|nr:class D sortase [Sulfobacillus harzensis]NMP24160.1 class D sortase [Sulfobacillus harzensis]
MKRWAGGILVALGLLLAGRVAWFHLHSDTVGHRLVHQYIHAETVGLTKSYSTLPSGVIGVLSIPSLQEKAPIVAGTDMGQLAVGVGHLTDSVMPGQPGTSVLAGHNVTWFHRLNQLKVGEAFFVREGRYRYAFRIERKAIVPQGTPVLNSRRPTVVLESCYPMNALYFTPYRYLIWAREVGVSTIYGTPQVSFGKTYAAAGIPAALKAQGLTRSSNDLPMGQLQFKGTPSLNLMQSNAPLSAAEATTTLYFAAVHTLLQHRLLWGQNLGIPASSALWRVIQPGDLVAYLGRANESLGVVANQICSTQLAVKIAVTSPRGARRVVLLLLDGKVKGHQVWAARWVVIPSHS